LPALPSWLTNPLWDQFAALVPPRPEFVATHPWGCHRRRVADRIVFDKLLTVLRLGCPYEAVADASCSATTLRTRRDEWIALGVFGQLARIAGRRRPHRRARAGSPRRRRRDHQSPRGRGVRRPLPG
jgi:transposase